MRLIDFKEVSGKIIAGKFQGVRRDSIKNKKGEHLFYKYFLGISADDVVYRISINEEDVKNIDFPKLNTAVIVPVVDFYNKKNFHSIYIDTEKLGLKRSSNFERLDLVDLNNLGSDSDAIDSDSKFLG
jgi:hypothetical protein